MENEALIAAVQLSDRGESDQPDPLYISKNELTGLTWRHFATLLKSLYACPPEAVRVKYMDDESDWIELGSDAELKEAIKFTQRSGEILQLQVCRVDSEMLIQLQEEATDAAPASPYVSLQDQMSLQQPGGCDLPGVDIRDEPRQFVMYIPTTDPDSNHLPPLQYPHPTEQQTQLVYPTTTGAAQNCMPSAPVLPATPLIPEPAVVPAYKLIPAVEHVEASKPDETPQEPMTQATFPSTPVDTLVYPHEQTPLVAPAAPKLWDQAANLSSDEKIKFLKRIAEAHHKQKKQVQPLCSDSNANAQCLGHNFIPNQDPFELDGASSGPTSSEACANFKGGQNMEILTPTPVDASSVSTQIISTCSQSSSVDSKCVQQPTAVITAQPRVPPTHVSAQSRQTASIAPQLSQKSNVTKVAATKAMYSSTVVPKSKLPKKLDNGTPVPLPRNLLMMEGAQSGANAVAIEIPPESESYYGAASKEEEIAASGGASSTPASEETGETLARGGSVAAAVDGEAKGNTQNGSCAVAPMTNQGRSTKERAVTLKELAQRAHTPKSSSSGKPKVMVKKSDAPAKVEAVKRQDSVEPKVSETFGVGARPLQRKSKKKAEPQRKKRVSVDKEEVKKVAKEKGPMKDEESGETAIVPESSKKETKALQYDDFLRHMKKVKKDLHTSIVHDVTKQTSKLLKKSISRSQSESHDIEFRFCNVKGETDTVVHKGITCDHCDLEIVGIRYKCGNCPDFDLCEKCESSEFVHDPTHVFLKLRKPARKAGCVGKDRVALLRENIYVAEQAWEEKRKEKEEKKKAKEEKNKEREEKKREKKEKKACENKEQEKQETEMQLALMRQLDNIMTPDDVKVEVDTTETEQENVIQVLEDRTSLQQDVDEEISCQVFRPVERERLNSASSGSSIVRLSPPPPFVNCVPTGPDVVPLYRRESQEKTECVYAESTEEGALVMPSGNSAESIKSDNSRPKKASSTPALNEDDGEEEEDDAYSLMSGSSYEYFLSDDDDFCILSAPNRDDYEDFEQEGVEGEEQGEMKSINGEDVSNWNMPEDVLDVGEKSDETPSSDEKSQQPESRTISVIDNENSNKEGQEVIKQEAEVAVVEVPEVTNENRDSVSGELHWAELVHSLTDKEKVIYEQMLQAELDKEKQMEKALQGESESDQEGVVSEEAAAELVRRHQEREKELQERSQMKVTREEDYQEILEVKSLQAFIVNKELEQREKPMNVTDKPDSQMSLEKEEDEESLEVTARRILESEDQDETLRKAKADPAFYRSLTRDRHLHQMLEFENAKFAALNKGDHELVTSIESSLKKLDHQKQIDAKKVELVEEMCKQRQREAATMVDTSLTSSEDPEEQTVVVSLSQCNVGQTSAIPMPSSSPASVISGDNADTGSMTHTASMRDADCQTVSEPVGQATHLIQNVASGVSKAASSAFSTAKDVFYSLQAKQNEKRAQSEEQARGVVLNTASSGQGQNWTPQQAWVPKEINWVPPKSEWEPKESTWTPPQATWTPPQNTWTPPSNSYKPPVSDWTPPPTMTTAGGDSPKASEATVKPSVSAAASGSVHSQRSYEAETPVVAVTPAKRSSTSTSSSVTTPPMVMNQSSSPIASLHIADSALRREIQGMQRLIEMGFANREKNRQLLTRFDGDLERVVQILLQEEGEDHWAFHRH